MPKMKSFLREAGLFSKTLVLPSFCFESVEKFPPGSGAIPYGGTPPDAHSKKKGVDYGGVPPQGGGCPHGNSSGVVGVEYRGGTPFFFCGVPPCFIDALDR